MNYTASFRQGLLVLLTSGHPPSFSVVFSFFLNNLQVSAALSTPAMAPLTASVMHTPVDNFSLSCWVWVAGVSSLEGGSAGGARVL